MLVRGLSLATVRETIAAGVLQAITQYARQHPLINVNVEAGGRRGASKNAMIGHVQAARMRNPFYLSERQRETIRAKLAELASQPDAWSEVRLIALGKMMIDAILENVRAQQNKSGAPFRELTDRYAKEKRKAVGFVKPILMRTGDLLGGLRVTVTRNT